MIRAVVFDLDDTLISEKKYIESGYRHIASVLSKQLNKFEQEIFQLLNELFIESPKMVFNRLLEKLGESYAQDTIEKLINEYRNHFPTIEFYEDVLPCLHELRNKGIKLGIITDGYAVSQKQKLKAVRAYEMFDEIVITDELGREYWKPHIKPYELMKIKLNEDYNSMAYIGDNVLKDFVTANSLGITTIHIKRPDGIYNNLNVEDKYNARAGITNLKDLLEVLNHQ